MKTTQAILGDHFEYEPGRLMWGTLAVELTPDDDRLAYAAMQADDARRLQHLFYTAQLVF